MRVIYCTQDNLSAAADMARNYGLPLVMNMHGEGIVELRDDFDAPRFGEYFVGGRRDGD
jgi:hypothetical protein